jgi:very-short-patch-repair endonuclease
LAPQRRTSADPEVLDLIRGLIGYTRDLVRSRRRPIRDCERYDARLWAYRIPDEIRPLASGADGVLLSVTYVAARPYPQLPMILSGWVDTATIDKPELGDPKLAEVGPAPPVPGQASGPPGGVVVTIPRSEALDVLRAYEEWLAHWRRWATEELVLRPHRELYRQLSEMARRVDQADDVFEIVLGVGLLNANVPGKRNLNRHLITRRLIIATDRRTAEITISLAPDTTVRLEDRDFLDEEDDYVVSRTEQVRLDLADQDFHPLAEETWDLLRRWADLAFDAPVRVDNSERPGPTEREVRCLSYAPAIILRQRDDNALVEFYDRIAGSLSGPNATSPLGLAQLVAPLNQDERLAWDGFGNGGSIEDSHTPAPEPLFPLPANHAQRDVLDRMRSDTAVVVQGPPGTGKTHTIANLVSAYLAEGKRVLVTSQKDQALRELRDKVPQQLRDLCVMLTGIQRGGSTDEMERSITALSDQVSSSSIGGVRRMAEELTGQRSALRSRRAVAREAIRELREAEWTEHRPVAPGYGGTLSAIVARVRGAESSYGWLTAPVAQSSEGGLALANPPLTTAEMFELKSLHTVGTPQRHSRRDQRLPAVDSLPSPEEFADAVSAARRADELADETELLGRQLCDLGEAVVSEVGKIVELAASVIHDLHMPPRLAEWGKGDWRTRALADLFAGRDNALWQHVGASAHEAEEAQSQLTSLGLRRVHVPEMSLDEAARLSHAGTALHEHLSSGGSIRRRFVPAIQREAAPLLDRCTVDGRAPYDAADLGAVLMMLRARLATAELVQRWSHVGVLAAVGDEPIPAILSRLVDLANDLAKLKQVGDARHAADRLLNAHGVRLDELSRPDGWDNLSRSLAAARALLDAKRGMEALDRIWAGLPSAVPEDPPELRELRVAVRSRDSGQYECAIASLRRAVEEQHEQQRCDELHARLHFYHPSLATELAATAANSEWDARLSAWPEAWAWMNAKTFCERMRGSGRDVFLQQELKEIEDRLAQVTERLAAAHAWSHCLQRMTQEQRQALQSYRSAMGALGKGTGRYASRHRRAARAAMAIARDAVPAWIMSIQRVVETIPAVQDSFDVVIVDEASQAGLDALFLLWLAPRVIVVGDDKQCAPTFTVSEHQKFFDRLDTYLAKMQDAFRNDFRPDNNLYELLSARFPDVVRLTEHFRCMPEIIGWSSAQFYDNRLEPLRQFGADRLRPLQVVRVQGGYVEGRDQNIRNEVEAKQLLETVQQMLADPAYARCTIGIIALQGTGQVGLIDAMVAGAVDPAVQQQHDIRVGTPPDFQGAERDVILLSMVVTDPPRALTRREEQRRFNVAASRARDQLWLFTSVSRERLRRTDLRHSLLSYMEEPPSLLGKSIAAANVSADFRQQPFESLFEQRVFLRIRQRGYHVTPQFPVGRRRIDLVVSGHNGRLAVECDGRVAHSTPDQIRDDMERERELRRVGWEFWRVRESEFAFDPDGALQSLWTELERGGIQPSVDEQHVGDESSSWVPAELPEEDEYPGEESG